MVQQIWLVECDVWGTIKLLDKNPKAFFDAKNISKVVILLDIFFVTIAHITGALCKYCWRNFYLISIWWDGRNKANFAFSTSYASNYVRSFRLFTNLKVTPLPTFLLIRKQWTFGTRKWTFGTLTPQTKSSRILWLQMWVEEGEGEREVQNVAEKQKARGAPTNTNEAVLRVSEWHAPSFFRWQHNRRRLPIFPRIGWKCIFVVVWL